MPKHKIPELLTEYYVEDINTKQSSFGSKFNVTQTFD
jgi:hypothetical protein